MDSFQKNLKYFFDVLDRVQRDLSERWIKHSNRRTTAIILIVGVLATYIYLSMIRPPDMFPIGQLVTVPAGSSLAQISQILKDDGVVRSATAFYISAIILGKGRDMRAGDYLFKEPRDVFSIARAVSIGAYGLEPIRIRVPEGDTTRQMAVIFGSQLQRFNQANFLAQAQPMEGYLFPDTYFFLPNATEGTVIQTMRAKFDEKLDATSTVDGLTLAQHIQMSGHSLQDIVIMASIVEREAGNDNDRRQIAGVLWNRISKNMNLQVDPTFLYTIGKGSSQLTKTDLTSDSTYNTYTHPGLPPGPIDSPSLDSLFAAATPIKSDYLFYLADANGVTYYSKTYQQHLDKKILYIGN